MGNDQVYTSPECFVVTPVSSCSPISASEHTPEVVDITVRIDT